VLEPELLIGRIAQTLRAEVGPAIEAPYPRTQAFMASVILERVARHVTERASIAVRAGQEVGALCEDLADLLPESWGATIDAVAAEGTKAALCGLVEGLYGGRDELGEEAFSAARDRTRRTLRALLDAEVAVAR
jgi:hypothetical protein